MQLVEALDCAPLQMVRLLLCNGSIEFRRLLPLQIPYHLMLLIDELVIDKMQANVHLLQRNLHLLRRVHIILPIYISYGLLPDHGITCDSGSSRRGPRRLGAVSTSADTLVTRTSRLLRCRRVLLGYNWRATNSATRRHLRRGCILRVFLARLLRISRCISLLEQLLKHFALFGAALDTRLGLLVCLLVGARVSVRALAGHQVIQLATL